jgi:hypothetical protein
MTNRAMFRKPVKDFFQDFAKFRLGNARNRWGNALKRLVATLAK